MQRSATTMVQEVMSTNLKTIGPDTTLEEIGDHLAMYNFHHLPVVDGDKLVGMVSASDFRQIAHGIDLVKSVQDIDLLKVYRSITAEKIMTKNPFSIPPNTTLDDVAEIFGKEKFHAIPVIENSVLVGIISIHDVNFHKYG